MRHKVFGRKLGRDINSRKALLSNLAGSLIVNGKITTTVAKVRFARPYIEKLVTQVKKNKLHLNRAIASRLTHQAFLRLTEEISPGFATRSGGYTRIVKLGPRTGDAALMARLEFLPLAKSEGIAKTVKKQKKVGRNAKKAAKVTKTKAQILRTVKQK
ncbi:50S ribosomal protein L17 [Candidatus Curtissbacteria bacterium]|nr:50S ribosomal protein L17 [Candidatus Curtissbacteria bacterium]